MDYGGDCYHWQRYAGTVYMLYNCMLQSLLNKLAIDFASMFLYILFYLII